MFTTGPSISAATLNGMSAPVTASFVSPAAALAPAASHVDSLKRALTGEASSGDVLHPAEKRSRQAAGVQYAGADSSRPRAADPHDACVPALAHPDTAAAATVPTAQPNGDMTSHCAAPQLQSCSVDVGAAALESATPREAGPGSVPEARSGEVPVLVATGEAPPHTPPQLLGPGMSPVSVPGAGRPRRMPPHASSPAEQAVWIAATAVAPGAGAAAGCGSAAEIVSSADDGGGGVVPAAAGLEPAGSAGATQPGPLASAVVSGPGFAARPVASDSSSDDSNGQAGGAAEGSADGRMCGDSGAVTAAASGPTIVAVERAMPAAPGGPGLLVCAPGVATSGPASLDAAGVAHRAPDAMPAALHGPHASAHGGGAHAVPPTDPGPRAFADVKREAPWAALEQSTAQHRYHSDAQDAPHDHGGSGVRSPSSSIAMGTGGPAPTAAQWLPSQEAWAAGRPVAPRSTGGPEIGARITGPDGDGDEVFLLPLLQARRDGGLWMSAAEIVAFNVRVRERLRVLRQERADEGAFLEGLLMDEAARRRAAEAALARLRSSGGQQPPPRHRPV